VLALTTEKRLLEYRVINAHRTLAHGLGRALIEARSLKGLLALPGRVRRLSMKQRAKRRERVPNSFTDDVAAILRLVDPAFERAAADGMDAAVDWAKTQKAEPVAKARALAELAHWSLDGDPAKAGRIGEDAARIFPGEQRLFSLAVRLREKGLILAPARLCNAICTHQPLSQPQSRLCDLMAEDAALLEHGRWGEGLECGSANSGDASMAIVCPPRWTALPWVLQAQQDAAAAGLSVSIVTPADTVNFPEFSSVHIFADSIAMACASVSEARTSGCRIILDIANPPSSMLAPMGSERATVDTIRLKGLAALAETVIVRSRSLARHLDALDIDHLVTGDARNMAAEIDEGAIATALAEYGARSGVRSIGCFAALDGDPGIANCLEAFAAIAASGDAAQLLIFGKGSHAAHLAGMADTLGIAGQVQFIGMPPPQRWSALLAALDLAVFPRNADEALGSEIPILFVQALAWKRPLLASETAWNAQAAFVADPGSVLTADGDLAEQLRAALRHPAGTFQPTFVDDPLAALYQAFTQPS
jgi:glycosyltransferase involved in cell wall biosynthesis